jgi:hypothetical protein
MTDQEIEDKFDDADVYTTYNPLQAIYLLRDGTLINGDYGGGARGIDHAIVECLFDDGDRYSDGFWDSVFEETEMVMLVPETKQVVYPSWMTPTKWQKEYIDELVNEYGYEIAEDEY